MGCFSIVRPWQRLLLFVRLYKSVLSLAARRWRLKSDSQLIIRMINGEYVIDASLEYLIYDIKFSVSQLGKVRFVFVKRHGNVAAHVVASYVTSHGGVFHWDASGPELLFNIVDEDVNVSVRI